MYVWCIHLYVWCKWCTVVSWFINLIHTHMHASLSPAWGTVRIGPSASLLTLSFFVKSPHPVVLCQVSSPCRSLSSLLTLSFFVKSPHPVVLCQVSSPCRSLSSLLTLSFFVKSPHPVVLCPVSPMSEDACAWC